jgi:hypothetical protein
VPCKRVVKAMGAGTAESTGRVVSIVGAVTSVSAMSAISSL